MSNATEKLALANFALMSIGQNRITAIDSTSVDGSKINDVLEKIIEELLDEDWHFNRKRLNVSDLTKIYLLEVDTAPSTAWAVGNTLTGQTSSVTCIIKKIITTKKFWVTEPSGDFTDGEIISNGSHTVDCASGYPVVDESALENWEYAYLLPTDLMHLKFLCSKYSDKDKYKYYTEESILFCNYDDAILSYNRKLEESTGVSDVTLMPQWFHRLISARLAFVLAPNVTENMKHRQKAEVEWTDAYIHALERDGDYNDPDKQWGNENWTDGVETELGY